MKFSTWNYTRPDYSEVKKKINNFKDKMQNATSYQMLRDAWLDVKREIEYMEFQEEIIYIRHLCGIDYQYRPGNITASPSGASPTMRRC